MTVAGEPNLLQRFRALGDGLDRIRRWLEGSRLHPIAPEDLTEAKAALADLALRSRQLEAQPAVLTLVLLGGTGVGKSTLLNALARDPIAQASIVRPTTRQPTVYHHSAVAPVRLAPVLGRCRIVPHDRPELRDKVLVDTPDVDGNVPEHREMVREFLPFADAVLYVGSQEKYHDRFAWDLLLEHRATHGFAFVLNKWDRCLAYLEEPTGRAPDVDFRASLAEAGFESPLVFRTVARQWVGASSRPDADPIEDDFPALERWIDAGLDARTIAEIKGRGLGGALDDLIRALERALPPSWVETKEALAEEWREAVRQSVADQAELLVESADRQVGAFERHFAQLRQGRFRGLFGTYLRLIDRLGRMRWPVLPTLDTGASDSRIEQLSAHCVTQIPAKQRRARQEQLRERLLALAARRGWPVEGMAASLDRHAVDSLGDESLVANLSGELGRLEHEFTDPAGSRYALGLVVTALCEWLPWLVLVLMGAKLGYDLLLLQLSTASLLAAPLLFAATIVGLHAVMRHALPVRWSALRVRLKRMVEDRLRAELLPRHEEALESLAARLEAERTLLLGPMEELRQLRGRLQAEESRVDRTGLFARPTDSPGPRQPDRPPAPQEWGRFR